MLDREIVEAVERGVFHIYTVETIDQGIEILTGVSAGTADEPGTINYLAAQRLREMAEKLRPAVAPVETRVIRMSLAAAHAARATRVRPNRRQSFGESRSRSPPIFELKGLSCVVSGPLRLIQPK